jgi:hypothetical protein
MRRFLHESHCLDVSSHLKEHPTPGVRVFNQTLFEFATHHQEPAYDFISLNHTLEHLSELKKVRHALKKLLRPAGFLLIEVPAQQSYSPSIIEHTVDHIHYFSAGSLSRFLEDDYRLCWLKRFRYAEKDKVDVGATEVLRALARRQESSATRGKAQSCTARLVATVESRIRNASSVMVWGTGYHTRLLFSLSPLIHEKTTCLIDSDPVRGGRTLYGKRVVHPSSLNNDEKAVLIISSYDYRADIHEAARKHFREENIINPYLSVKG